MKRFHNMINEHMRLIMIENPIKSKTFFVSTVIRSYNASIHKRTNKKPIDIYLGKFTVEKLITVKNNLKIIRDSNLTKLNEKRSGHKNIDRNFSRAN